MPSDAAEPEEPAPDLTGRTIGDFQVLRKIGAGGMGQVYLARQLSLKREVALKILRTDLAENATALKRFQAEAEAVARIMHPNIVQVFAVGEQAGLRYMALEYVDGRNLRDYLARRGPPDLPVALSIMRQVAAALQRASEIGIVHRDIKPENILITRKGEVKVADFGLSRYFAADGQALNLTQSGMTLGTPLYMSPEQVQGRPVDHRSDIYSFGVTSYQLLAGHAPFQGATAFEVAVQHVQTAPPPLADVRPDLPADLCAVVHKMMAKEPAERYQTARDVIRDLTKVQKGLSVGLPPVPTTGLTITTVPTLSGMTSGMPPALPAAAPSGAWVRVLAWALLLVALAAAGWWAYGYWSPPPDPRGEFAGPGLPDAHPPEPVTTARERDLEARIASRSSTPAEVFQAQLELALLYVKERRLDEAEKAFQDLESERPVRLPPVKGAGAPAVLAGRLGRGIVLAYRDKPAESNEQIERALFGPPRVPSLALDRFFLAHPDLAQALGIALDRNAENLNQSKLPDRLEWLRTPGGLARGPKG